MATVNDRLRDAGIRRQLRATRVGKALATRIRRLVETSEDDLAARLQTAWDRIDERGFDQGPVTTDRLTRLLAILKEMNAELGRQVHETARDGLVDLARTEAALTGEELASEMPPMVSVSRPSMAIALGGRKPAVPGPPLAPVGQRLGGRAEQSGREGG